MLTQERLKELIKYNPETGKFVNRINRQGTKGIGDEVGGVDRGTGYCRASVDGRLYQAHRLAFLYMTGAFPENDTDHINGDRADNKWANLRAVTNQENSMNSKRPSTNTSGVIGVRWYKAGSKWRAQIKSNGILKHLGLFINKTDAIIARKMAEYEYGFHFNHGRLV